MAAHVAPMGHPAAPLNISGYNSRPWILQRLVASGLLLLLVAMAAGGMAASAAAPDNREIRIALLAPRNTSHLFAIERVLPALEYGRDSARVRGLLPNTTIRFIDADSKCNSVYGPVRSFDLHKDDNVHIFFGPVCDYSLAPVARFAPFWRVPVLSPGGMAHDFGENKSAPAAEFPNLTRIGSTFDKMTNAILAILEEFNWSRVKLIYNSDGHSEVTPRFCYLAINAVVSRLRLTNITFKHYIFKERSNFTEMLVDGVDREFAIVVLCASPDSVREIMMKAAELHFDNGEYVFFNIDLFSSKSKIERPWFRPNDTAETNSRAQKAYESLMTVTLRKPNSPEYASFSDDVKRRAEEQYGDTIYGKEEVNSFVGAFHDAVILYALALNETLERGFDATNGTEITRRMWNRTFEGITGTVSIDENGDRNADYSLLDLNPETQTFVVVANYYGNKKVYEPEARRRIHWAGARVDAPPDVPKCGFDGSGCPPDEPFPDYAIVVLVLGSLLISVLLVAFFIYRHYRLEAELAEVNWRVRWDDIMFGVPEKRRLERSGSRLSLRRTSIASNVSGDTLAVHLSDMNKQIFTKTGYYKATLIAIKKINKPNISVTKPLTKQFKKMRDLQNDHVVRFIGVCIDAPNQCILTEYCQKGSLQDVLENEQIKLDHMFKFSLIQDIVRGMSYIHSSDIRSHGNLKSSNCVVDSRFVLKLTDFGLQSLRGTEELVEEDTYIYYRAKLCAAPELLRLHAPPPEGTQKGDVYSFAIICQEIVYRNGTFWVDNMDLSPQEIYRKVKNGLRPYFRPTLDHFDDEDGCNEDLANMIKRCWAEDPLERPDFNALKTILRKINKDGDSGNILDNLLSRMEQYANNLEALVEERTADYLEQKKRAEDLLYMMLPKSVAGQLMRGESVAAEKFDSVTIYFSDICGFTALSSQSTPLQVVDLLNDLYTTFDSIVDSYDVYKVETIGDAYMVVSGLPQKNGMQHAREVARMSIALLNAVKSFKIRHRPHDQLRLRIGIHSGPVVTGVVGLKMPRYCLFGDTVNTASRMESNGEALRIHVSPFTKEILDTFGTFVLDLRGPVEMKGKGTVITWWLNGENNPAHPDFAPKELC